MMTFFWLPDTFNLMTYGMGRARRVMSTRMFGIEMAKRNFVLSTLQDALTDLSQNPRVGMHCSKVRRNCRGDHVRMETCLKFQSWQTYHRDTPYHDNYGEDPDWCSDAAHIAEDSPVKGLNGELDSHDNTGICQLSREKPNRPILEDVWAEGLLVFSEPSRYPYPLVSATQVPEARTPAS